jgi:uncharacterized OB-fold protein
VSADAATPWVVEQNWDVTYQHVADEVTATFLRTLAEEGRLIGRRCPRCERVLLPPTELCDRDLCPTEEWVDLPLSGTIRAATIVFRPVRGLFDPPYALAYVEVDGADTAIPGLVQGLSLEDPERARAELEPGRPVEVIVAAERAGRISDVGFRLR